MGYNKRKKNQKSFLQVLRYWRKANKRCNRKDTPPGNPIRLRFAVKSGENQLLQRLGGSGTIRWTREIAMEASISRGQHECPRMSSNFHSSFRYPNAILGEEAERLSNYLKRLHPTVSWSWGERILKLKGSASNSKRCKYYKLWRISVL